MESSAKLNRTRWAMQVALIIGLALLFLAAWLWGLQRTTMARTNPDDLGAGPIGSSPHDTPGGGAPRWTPLGGPAASGGQVNALAAHPAVAGTAYAAVAPAGAYDSGPSVIYKTTDGAASWTPVYTAEHQVYALGVSGSNVYAGAFNPGGEGPSLYVSQDSGVSWTPVFSFTERGVWSDLAVHPTDVDVAIVGGWAYHGDDVQSGLVYATDDAGMTWTPILTVTFPGIEGSVNGVMIHPITPTLLLASAHADDSDDSIIYRSEDGGATWPVSVTIPGAHVVSLAAHGSDGQMVYAGTGGSTFTEGPSVVLRSTDAGLSWTEVFDEGGGWVAFEAPNTVYATSGCDDVFRSTSGGDPGTWSKVESPEDCMRSFSAGVTPGVLYAGGEEKGVFKSSDGGDSWEERNEGIQSLLQAVDIDVDPENLDKLFAAAECGGGWMTTDGGETWMQPSGVSGCMGAFAINPDNLDVVYGGGYDDGRGAVMRSDDGGLTFERVYTASFILPDGDGGGEQIHALAIAPSMSATVYAAGADEPEGEDEHAVVVRSVDDGASWTEVFTGPEESEVRALAINPTDEDTVYAGGEDCSGPDCMGFIYRTIDGGDTWTEVFTTSETVHSIVIDQQTPELVYASADNYEVYKSSDGGGSWTVIRSCCPSGNLLAIDPHRSGRLYLAGWGYVAESSDGGQSWSDQGAPINQGVPRMEPRALVVDNGDVIQTLYAGFSGVWAYRRLAPQEGDRYVATTGSDADNPCVDPYAPCRTIGHAVEMANAGETVLVAQGTYTENLSVSKRVTLAGGYEAVNWTRDLTQYETVIDGSGSQTVWGDWDGNAIYAPAVITDAGVLRMWYTGADEFGTGRIGHAESADGVNWTRLITNPVLEIGAPGDWDEEGVGQPSVIKQGGLYQMWFFGGNDDGVKQVGYATSTNGIDWTKHPGNPVLTVGGEGAWDETEVGGPRVLFDGATYHLWYHGYSGSCCDSIGYATSPDGINWTKHSGNPVFGRGDPGEWDDSFILATAVLSDGGQLHMWYSTSWVDNAGIGYVTSTNGISWTRFLTGPVLPVGSPGEWDENYVSWPAVIRDGGAYRMWYRGHDDGWWVQFGYATSPDGIVWTRSVSNPVFSPGAPTQWGDPVVRFEGGSGGSAL
ncbi:MAG: hypothetical protein PVI07_13600, partial [Anaerolineae bacterium]